MEKLTDHEVDVMMAIWSHEDGLAPTGYILKHIKRAKRNPLQVLQVVLRRLCEKGCIQCVKGKQTNIYIPKIEREAYVEFAGEIFLEHHYPSNPLKFALGVISKNRELLTEEDVKKLQEILEQRGQGEESREEQEGASAH